MLSFPETDLIKHLKTQNKMNASLSNWIMLLTPLRNVSIPDIETLYSSLGMVNIFSLLYVTVQITTVSIGFILNVISLCIFSGKSFKLPLYFYLRVMILASLICCLLIGVYDLCISRQYVFFSNSPEAIAFLAYIRTFLPNILLYMKFITDAILVLDRLATFKPRVKH
jgi:hypothetical protein